MDKEKLHRTQIAAARAQSKLYYTGEPCPFGHDAPRYTSSAGCVECLKAASAAHRAKIRRLLAGEDA